jgi:hypothetical protein
MRTILCIIAMVILLEQCLACAEGSMQTAVPCDGEQVVISW